jgi:RNA polymerase sigma factor (TIGR02999 family)
MAAPEMTELLQRASRGDKAAESDLLACVYQDLHAIAADYFRHERPDHTLQPTVLVHDAYLRLIKGSAIDWESRAHFFSLAARVMRRLLVDHARRKRAGKRGGGEVVLVMIDPDLGVPAEGSEQYPELDAALERLESFRPRWAKVVDLRYFAGMTEVEIAEVLGTSEKTIKRDWKRARAWLYDELNRR